MASFAANRRSLWSKAVAILSVAGLATFVAAPWLLREWHAWHGYRLFVEKQFAQASSHLADAREGAPLAAAHFGLPPAKFLYAQSLLVTKRDAEAIWQYSELADLDPTYATLAFIVALHDATRSNWASATARLERHKASSACRPCEIAHGMFQAAAEGGPRLDAARRQQQIHLAGMKGPAGCLFYRAGSAAASALAAQMLDLVARVMTRHLLANGMTKQAAERAVSFATPFLQQAFGDRIEAIAKEVLDPKFRCAQSIQLHEMLRLKGIPYAAEIEQWVEFKTLEGYVEGLPYVGPYVSGAKDALEVGVHLRQIAVLAVAYAMSYKSEGDARSALSEADTYTKSQWDAVRIAAERPEFATQGAALLGEGVTPVPSEKSWFEIIKPYLWPF
jgi:hypothetical protein